MKLFLMGTPIGNLEDMTLRALRILKEINIVFCEDTRRTKALLEHFSIRCKCIHLSKLNETQSLPRVLSYLDNESVAYLSDAGMPLISDPGFFLINELRKKGYDIELIPGPSSLCSAVAYSGFIQKEFLFLGFLPEKKKQIIEYVEPFIDLPLEMVLFISPHKIKKQVPVLAQILGPRKAIFCKELTKIHEQTIEFKLDKLPDFDYKGEFVLIIQRADFSLRKPVETLKIIELEKQIMKLDGIGAKQRASLLSTLTGESKKEIYNRILRESKKSDLD